MRSLVFLALAACSVPATKFTPVGGGGGDDGGPPGGDGSNAGAAKLSASPTGDTIALGTVVIGQTSGKTAIMVTNDGDEASGALAIAFDDAGLGFAVVDDGCSGMPLQGHTTCTFSLQFSPSTAAALQTNIHVSADPGGEVTKILQGNGLLQGAVDIVEDTVNFGLAGLGAAGTTKTFNVRNTGQAQVGQPTPSTGDPSYTVMATTCNGPLNQTDTCTITVLFKPTAVGAKASSLVIMSNPGGSDAAQLSGTGFAHVTVTRSGDGVGNVRSSPAGIDCGTTCAADFTVSPITLTGTAGTESTFTAFGGDCTGGTCSLNLTANKAVDGKFTLNSYNVVAAVADPTPDNGTNKVSSTPAGINCDGATGCVGAFKFGSSVRLDAVPDPVTGRFAVWSDGPCAGMRTPTCTFTVPSGGVHAGASFEWWGSLQILANVGTDGLQPLGTLATTSDLQINCNTVNLGGACRGFFGRGETVTIKYTGNPTSGWTSCHGGPAGKFLNAVASGSACQPDTSNLCPGSTQPCVSSVSCNFTFDQPVDVDSEWDISCDTVF